jgi:predicted dehydrogenase
MYRDDANVAALLTFGNGVMVTYQGTWAGNHDSLAFDWRTDCAQGIAVQSDMFGALSSARRDEPALSPVDIGTPVPWRDDAAALWADFTAHLLDGAPLNCSGADHLHSLRMVEAAVIAAKTGLTINPADLQGQAEPDGRTPPRQQVQSDQRSHA